MKVVVGLGNPGRRYAGTRHNVGYAVIDLLAQSVRAGRFQNRLQAQIAELSQDQDKILLVKPETFMNLSGACVRGVLDYYQVPLKDMLIVCDDVNLPLGKLRIRAKGSAGGHNGLKNIQQHLGTSGYARLRIGVGGSDRPELIDHVLGRFRPSEQATIDEAIGVAADAVVTWANEGVEAAMNQYNG
jgi:PTH1 family peptidyl-tRNA hydrolase